MHRDRLVRGFREQDWRLLGEGRLLLEQRTFDAAAGVAQTTQTLIDAQRRARLADVLGARLHGDRALLRHGRPARASPRPKACGDLDGGAFGLEHAARRSWPSR